MGTTPSIFEPTPEEHAEATARYLEKLREVAVWPLEPVVPPGCVRVQFYAYRYKVRDGLRPDIEAVIPLEQSGELSFFAVRRLWGLETCSVIDPPELKLGFPADPNFLPAGVVKELLTKHGCIKLVEPYTSYETLIKRQLRHIALAGTSAFRSWSILAAAGARNDYRTISRAVKRLSEPYRITQKRSIQIDWARAANLIFFLAILSLLFKSLGKGGSDFGFLLRLGNTVADMVAASTCLTWGLWACLATLFFVAPGVHAKTLEMEDEVKLMFVLSG